MAWNTPSTWLSGAVLTAAQLNAQLRDNMKAIGDPWTAYTPALGGIVLGNGTLAARYALAGKMVHWSVTLTFGTTTSFVGNFQIGLPPGASTRAGLKGRSPLGRAVLFDSSTSSIRMWDVAYGDAVNLAYLCDVNGSIAHATSPWTWANGDSIELNACHEAA